MFGGVFESNVLNVILRDFCSSVSGTIGTATLAELGVSSMIGPGWFSTLLAWHPFNFHAVMRIAKSLAAFRLATYTAGCGSFVKSLVVGPIAYLKVFDPVVVPDVVDVVDKFGFKEWPSKVLAHDEPVFKYVSINMAVRVIRFLYEHISISVFSAARFVVRAGLWICSHPFKPALPAPWVWTWTVGFAGNAA